MLSLQRDSRSLTVVTHYDIKVSSSSFSSWPPPPSCLAYEPTRQYCRCGPFRPHALRTLYIPSFALHGLTLCNPFAMQVEYIPEEAAEEEEEEAEEEVAEEEEEEKEEEDTLMIDDDMDTFLPEDDALRKSTIVRVFS